MLRGRGSLIRLIGKRRRILPNRQTLLASPHQQESLVSPKQENGEGSSSNLGGQKVDKCGDDVNEKPNTDLVNCPVCGKSIRGSDRIVNSHLDTCLTRGTKRKLAQRTLLQFSFGSRPIDNFNLHDLDNIEANMTQRGLNEMNHFFVPLNSHLRSETREDVLVEDPSREVSVEDKELGTPSIPDISEPNGCSSLDDILMPTLNTSIVGRRFSDKVELKQGDIISLLRDPFNVKDPNAIKVISPDAECIKVIGFLPRELTSYLSPLIDNYQLRFEGSVMSPPKHSLDTVPIQISGQKMAISSENDSHDNQVFESLWKSVLHVVEYAKNSLPNTAKYQQNFCTLIQEVMKNHRHLFTDDEKLFIDSFSSLSDDSQRIFIRLYTRKGPWFRMSNISYQEILDSEQAIEELCAMGYMRFFKSMNKLHDFDFKEVLDVLTVSELREILSLRCLKKGISSIRRQELIASLLTSYEDGTCPSLPNMVLDRTGTCVRISSTAEFLFWRVQRLFFFNGEQDLSAFLMVDLGLVKYPSYNCIVSNQLIPDRSDLLAYEEAIEVAQLMDESLDENNTETTMRCIEISDVRISSSSGGVSQFSIPECVRTFLSIFSSSLVYSKVVTLGISFLERERRYEDSIRLLKRLLKRITSDGRRGYWTLRLSVDLEHIGRLNESLSVAEEGLLDLWVRAGAKLALQRRILRLGKPPRRWKIPSFSESVKRKIKEVHVLGRPLNCELGVKNRFYGEDGEQCGVEQLALQYYAAEGGGWQGVHTESGIWMTIFGLLMWDVIFSDVSDVFLTKFQTAPLDLGTDNFYIARKSLIESHLSKIHDGMAEEILITSWELHVGTSCRGVNWDRHPLSDLRAAVTCVGGPSLASLCRLLAQDYKSWSSGMPDLLLWRFFGEYKGGEAKLVEIKGPKDSLSEQQRAWLLLLMDIGFSTEICKVGSRST